MILSVIIVCPLEWRGTCGKIGFDHAGDDGARLDQIDRSDGRIQLIELLAPAQKLGVDRRDLVQDLAHLVEVADELAHLGASGVRDIIHLRPLAWDADREVELRAVATLSGAMAARPAAALVSLYERAAHDAIERRKLPEQLPAPLAKVRSGQASLMRSMASSLIMLVIQLWDRSAESFGFILGRGGRGI